jgi:hypothetical protein
VTPAAFWSLVKVGTPDECWEWQGFRKETGYGRVYADGLKGARAHRLAYEFHYGEAPGELHVLHKCDNPPCCNPAHLRLGTVADNMHDKVARGRSNNVPRGSSHARSKLTEAAVRDIRRRFQRGKYGDSARAAREYGISKTTVAQVLRGEIWRHVR